MMRMNKKKAWLVAALLVLATGAGTAWHFLVPRRTADIVQGTASAATVQGKKSLIVYFTYSENMGDTSGMTADAITSASLHGEKVIAEGNMQVMVREIQKKTGADTYSIVAKTPYPAKFEDMTQLAKRDIQEDRVIPLKDPVPDLSGYDVIYFGSPIWWYNLPAPVRTFLREAKMGNKTVVPFGIHRGSGFSNNLSIIKQFQPGIQMTDGFTMDAKTPNQDVRRQFDAFLEKLL
jgi:flavodoxin